MQIDIQNLVYPVIGIGAGIYWFYTGFRDFKHCRTIENIPTSKIGTGAVGTNVEVKGRILHGEEKQLQGPVSGRDCVFYSVEIQKLVRSKNSSHWKTIDQFFSDAEFLLDDGSGAIASVYVRGAKIQRKGGIREVQARSNNFSMLPASLLTALNANKGELKSFKLEKSSWLFSGEYRFLEWCFSADETIYVLGYAESGLKAPKKKKLKFANFLKARKQIESDPELQSRFDQDQDGVLDEWETERGAKIIGERLQAEDGPVQVAEPVAKTKMIFKKRSSYPFIISNMPESVICLKKTWSKTFPLRPGSKCGADRRSASPARFTC